MLFWNIKKMKRNGKLKSNLELSALIGIFVISILAMSPVNADEIKFGFKNPSFSGVGT